MSVVLKIEACRFCPYVMAIGKLIHHPGAAMFNLLQCGHPKVDQSFAMKEENSIWPSSNAPIPEWCPMRDEACTTVK